MNMIYTIALTFIYQMRPSLFCVNASLDVDENNRIIRFMQQSSKSTANIPVCSSMELFVTLVIAIPK